MSSVVTIGGGTGTPVTNRALLEAGVPYIHSIITMMDNGGLTGKMRTDSQGRQLAYSDFLRALLSLIPLEKTNSEQVAALNRILTRRNENEQTGYTILSKLFDATQGGFDQAQDDLEQLLVLKLQGRVIPVTLEP